MKRLLVGAELLLAPLAIGLRALGVVRNPSLVILLVGCVSLSLRRAWGGVGLRWPRARALAVAAAIGVAYDAADVLVIMPLLRRLTGQPLHVEPFAGDVRTLLFWLAVTWTLAAFGEELAYRGYLLGRLGGGRLAAAIVSVLFGLAHLGQGLTGVLDNILAGALFAALYLRSGRNLWVPLVAHGTVDTTSFLLLYLGLA